MHYAGEMISYNIVYVYVYTVHNSISVWVLAFFFRSTYDNEKKNKLTKKCKKYGK